MGCGERYLWNLGLKSLWVCLEKDIVWIEILLEKIKEFVLIIDLFKLVKKF